MNIKFRFFQRLTTGQRMAVFQAFGVLGDDFDGKLTHSEEAQLLTEMLAGIRGADGWVSVGERLPDLHQTVALLDENRWMNTGSSDHNVNWHGSGYLCEFGSKYWSIFGESRSQCLEAVTHWMPLPAAPAYEHQE